MIESVYMIEQPKETRKNWNAYYIFRLISNVHENNLPSGLPIVSEHTKDDSAMQVHHLKTQPGCMLQANGGLLLK